MFFSSYLFIFFFLPLALLGYYAAPKKPQLFMLTTLFDSNAFVFACFNAIFKNKLLN